MYHRRNSTKRTGRASISEAARKPEVGKSLPQLKSSREIHPISSIDMRVTGASININPRPAAAIAAALAHLWLDATWLRGMEISRGIINDARGRSGILLAKAVALKVK